MTGMEHHKTSGAGHFSRDASGLPEARPAHSLALSDGEQVSLDILPVAKRMGASLVRMLSYNGSIPGPTLRVKQNSEISVHVTNKGDVAATIHWHGLRVENRYDGVPHETQQPIPVGGSFTYRIRFRDEGLYWYHPHIREDYAQEMGLYGNILVEPAEGGLWPPADREVILTLDDILLEDGRVAAFDRSIPNYVAMGRFGNVLLVNGEPDWSFDAAPGEVVRFWLTNTANTRLFNIRIPGAKMKLIGGDSGRVEHEAFVDEVLLAPSERAVVDVLFDREGNLVLEHSTPEESYRLGRITVSGHAVRSSADSFTTLRNNPEFEGERRRMEDDLQRQPDKVLAMVAEMGMDHGAASEHGKAGHQAQSGHGPQSMTLGSAGSAAGIEWEDTMAEMNRMSNPANMRWVLVDPEGGRRNGEIDWVFTVGDRVKIRIVNEIESGHPMHHPLHIHGAGRFLVIARDGAPEPNLVWKDSTLVRTGETVDLVLEVTNPGLWMVHCHIAEHLEAGMMFSFLVKDAPP